MDITLSEDIDAEYLEDVSDILTNREFLALNCFRHHYATTRLMHSMNVSYISWLLAKKLGCDAKAAARAGLLHDFFLYQLLRCGFGPAKIYRLACRAFEGIYSKETISKWLKTFCRRFFAQQFKRSCLPDGPKVGSVAVSPRGDLRMPSDASRMAWQKELDQLPE